MKGITKINEESGPEGTELLDHDIPTPGPGEVLVRVGAAAICGTDKHIFQWDPSIRSAVDVPRIYGHEFCGFVESVGEGVENPRIFDGAYVSAEMHVVCGSCRQCRTGNGHICNNTRILGLHGDGSFADFVVVPANNIVPLDPRIVPLRVGAFLDALGNAVHATQVFDLVGKSVLITGFGPIGAAAAAIAEHSGASSIIVTDISDHALETARRWAAHLNFPNLHAFNVRTTPPEDVLEAVRALTGEGVDVLLEMSGAESAINFGLRAIRMGGGVALLGLPADRSVTIENYTRDIIFKGLDIRGIIGRKMFDTWDRMVAMLAGGLDVSWIVQGEFDGLEGFHDAMDLFGDGRALKVVIYPEGAEAAAARLTAELEEPVVA